MTLKALYVNAITPTEETAKAIDERAAMGAIGDMDKYMKFKAARAMGSAAGSTCNCSRHVPVMAPPSSDSAWLCPPP